MEGRRRRAVSSPLGRVDLGENPGTLTVDDPTAAPPVQQQAHSQIPEHLMNNPNINIRNESDDIREAEDRVRQAREVARNQPARRESVDRMEVLVGIGRLTTELVVDNTKFSIRSLKNRENREVMKLAAKEESKIDELLTIKHATLAFAVSEIEGRPLYYFAGEDSLIVKLDVIEELDSQLVGRLWDAYEKMINDYQKTIGDDLGNTPKEISDTLKK